MEIFDHLKNLTEFKKDACFSSDEVKKSYNKFMINRFVSMVDFYLPVVNEINKYDVPEEVHYNYYLNALPKRKTFFNYIKKKKELDEEDKKYIATYFEVGKKEADMYINILDEDQILEILKIYKYGNNKKIEV